MSLNLQSLDTIAFSNKLSSNFSCRLSDDGRISILTENVVLIYTLMNYMDNSFIDMAFKKKHISLPDFSFSSYLGIDYESFYERLDRQDLFEKILRFNLTTKTKTTTAVDVKPIAMAWSHKGLQGKSHCVLSVLSNMHSLSIFIQYVDDGGIENYVCIANVTEIIIDHYHNEWENNSHSDYDIQIKEWMQRAECTCPTAFIWSSTVEKFNTAFAIFFVAHLDGSITCWKFFRRDQYDASKSSLKYVGIYQTSFRDITTMHWKDGKCFSGTLSYGNIDGKLAVVTVSDLTKGTLEFTNEMTFRNGNDNIKIVHITYIEYKEYTYLIAVTERYLLIWAITVEGLVVDEMAFKMDNTVITDIAHYKENILLVLTYGKLSKLTFSIIKSRIHVHEEVVSMKFDSTKFRTNGLVLSENRIFFGILAYPCRMKNITRDPIPGNFAIYYDSSIPLLETIMSNEEGTLAKYWDFFEVLRILSYREKKFPWLGIDENLEYDDLSLTQLKSLRWIAKISENVYHVIPSIMEYNIKPYILLHHMVTIKLVLNRMKKLLEHIANGDKLSTFQMRSLDVQSMYLKEMILMKILEKAKVGEKFIDDMIEVLEKTNELEYPDMPFCFWCEQKIIGPTCIPPHADSRCSITMMQIKFLPGFKCSFCKCVAHSEVAEEMEVVNCPYCDIPMDQVYSPETIESVHKDANHIQKELLANLDTEIVFSEDDIYQIDTKEEDTSRYLTLSDSEDEITSEVKTDYLRNKFFEMMKAEKIPVPSQDDLTEYSTKISDELGSKINENENSDYSFGEDSDDEEHNQLKKT